MGKKGKVAKKVGASDTRDGGSNNDDNTGNRSQPNVWGKPGGAGRTGRDEEDAGDDAAAAAPSAQVAEEAGPIPWLKDRRLTDQFISHISVNEELRDGLLTDGQLRRLEEGDTTKDDHFFDIAHRMFKDQDEHEEIKGIVGYASQDANPTSKKEVADLMRQRWHKLVDMDEEVYNNLGDKAKGIHYENQIEEVQDEDTKKRLEETKDSHPWYFKLRHLLSRQTEDAEKPGETAPVDADARGLENGGDLVDKEDLTGANEEPFVVSAPSEAESAPNGEALPQPVIQENGLTEPPTSTVTFDHNEGNNVEDDSYDFAGDMEEQQGSKLKRGGDHGARKPLPAPPGVALAIVPAASDIAAPVPMSVPHFEGLTTGSANSGRGRLSRPSSPAPGRSASRAGSARSVHSAIPVAHALPSKPVHGFTGLVVEDENREGRPTSPAFGRSTSRARSTGTARQADKKVDIVDAPNADAEPVRHGSTTRSRQPSVSGDRPKSVKEWAQEVASTTQIDPQVITATDLETLSPSPGEQLPSYSVEGGAQDAIPSGSGLQSMGTTSNDNSAWPGENKNRDDKHPYTALWTADANKTPHLGYGYDLPAAEPSAAPVPVMDTKASGKRPSLGRPTGGKLTGRDEAIFGSAPRSVSHRPRTPQPTTPEPVAQVLSVQIPPQRPVDVTVQPITKETPRNIENTSPVSRHSRTPSKPSLISALAGMASAVTAVAAPTAAESMAEGTKPAGVPRVRNVSGGSTETVKPKDVEEELPIVYQPKDAFRSTPRSSDPSPRSQFPPPIPSPTRTSYVPPPMRRAPSPSSSPAVPSRLRSVEPPLSNPSRTAFPEPDVNTQPFTSSSVSYQHSQPVPSPSTAATSPSQPILVRTHDFLRPSSSNKRQDLPSTPLNMSSSSRQPPSVSQSLNAPPVIAGAAALGAAAGYAATKVVDMSKGDRQRRRTSAEQRLGGSIPPSAAMPPQRGAYQPFVSVTGPTGYAAHARPLGSTPVTFDFGNQQDGGGVRGGTELRRTSGGRNPPLTVTVQPVVHPVGAVPASRSRSDSVGSEETVRQTRPLEDRYEQDRRDRERQLAREREREQEYDGYGLVRRRRWDDDRSVASTRVRYASPARSDEVDCDCSSCRNAWIWTSIEYCGLAVAFTLYLTFMAKVLFQNQGIRLF